MASRTVIYPVPRRRVLARPTNRPSRVTVSTKAVPPVRPRQKQVQSFDFGEIFNDVLNSLKLGLNRPLVVLSMVLVWGLILTHQDFSGGVVGGWASQNQNNYTFAKWIVQNSGKFLGMIVFIPTLFDLPESARLPLVVGVVLWVIMLPVHSLIQYLVQSLALHTFFKVRLAQTRLCLVGAVSVFYFLGETIAPQSFEKSSNYTKG